MQPLPVFAIAREVYRFPLRWPGTILRLTWAPLLVVTIVQYVATRMRIAELRSAVDAGSTVPLPPASFLLDTVTGLVAVVGTAVAAVALHRVILFGEHHAGRLVHLAFGKIEALFVALPIGAGLILFVLLLFVLPLLAVVPTFLSVPVLLVAVLAAVFFVVRLMLVFPITVVEGRYNFAQAWSLTRGNFWRLVGLWLVVFIPPTLVMVLIQRLFLSPSVDLLTGGNRLAATLDRMESLLFVQMAVSFVLSIIFGSLGVAMLSYSYKALNGRHPDDVLLRNV